MLAELLKKDSVTVWFGEQGRVLMECAKGASFFLVQYDSSVMSWLHLSELHVKY